jgi:peptide-methionine (S)-S-oxide reductase
MDRIRVSPVTMLLGVLALTVGVASFCARARSEAVVLPDPKLDAPAAKGDQVAVFAGGCFWGVEAVFEHVRGVRSATSGYAGGNAFTAHYEQVGTGRTGHAESVKVVYDPAQVSYGQLLKVFFSVAHDPTQLDRQGPDVGSQYRSAIFYRDDAQKAAAEAYIAQLDAARAFPRPIVTRVAPLKGFYVAEDYHQDYARLHPRDAYIVYNDAPKVEHLKALFPKLYDGG